MGKQDDNKQDNKQGTKTGLLSGTEKPKKDLFENIKEEFNKLTKDDRKKNNDDNSYRPL